VQRPTLSALLVAALIAAEPCGANAQTATPAASPLPEIGRVRSKGFCTTVRDNVAPSLLGVMKTDGLIGAGHRALAKMADDTVRSPQAVDLDRVYLDKVSTAIAHNLRVVNAFLSDKARFPDKPVTDDDRFAQLVRDQLAAVAAEQRRTLDVINGTLETDRMGQMRAELDNGMQAAVAPAQAPLPIANETQTSFLDSAGLPDLAPIPALSGRNRLTTGSTLGHRPFDRFTTLVEQEQSRIARAETVAAPTLTAAAYACQEAPSAPTP
jgi:hypothetical protein